MRRAMAGVFAAVLMVFLAACAGEPATIASDDAQLEALTVRMNDLQDKVVSAGRMTPQLKGDLAALVRDVEAWQKRTARTDLTVQTSSPVHDATMGTQAVIKGPGGGTGCSPCPTTKTYRDMICFLIDEGPCPTGNLGQVCVYTCFKLTRTAAVRTKPVGYA